MKNINGFKNGKKLSAVEIKKEWIKNFTKAYRQSKKENNE